MLKHTLSITLLFSMLTTLAACGGESPSEDTTASSLDTTTAETTEEGVHDDLPELDFNGEKVSLFVTDYEDYNAFSYVYAAEQDGDVVHDAIYNRNNAVADRLNVEFEFIRHPFEYSTRNEMYTAVRTAVMSGDEGYDIFCTPVYFNSTIIVEGLGADIKELPHVDLSKPYWFQGFNKDAEIDGKLYMAMGDGMLPYITSFACLAFNVDMADTYEVGDLYDMVFSGTWTLEKMHTIVGSMYKDLNGNTEPDEKDQYGLEIFNQNFVAPFMPSAHGTSIVKNETGYEWTYGSERMNDIYDRTFALLHENDNSTFFFDGGFSGGSAKTRAEGPFVQGRALFSGLTLVNTDDYRDLTFTYGILPYPKFDEAQDQYYVQPFNSSPAFIVSPVNEGSEMIGAVLEALNSEAYNTTTIAYFETALKTKYSTTDNMSRVFDLLRESETLPLGSMFAAELGGPHDSFKKVSNKDNSGIWSSTAAGLKDSTMEKLDTFLAKVRELE